MGGEETVHQLPDRRGHEAFLVEDRVFAILQRGDDAGIGRRATDAVFFQGFHQASLGVARRRLGEMLLAGELVHRHGFTFGQYRQLGFFLALLVVLVFLVDGDEAREHQGLAGGAEQIGRAAHGDIEAHRVELRRAYLARQGAFPDHFVEARLIDGEELAHRFRCARNGCRTNRLVRFLRILGFVAEIYRCCGQVAGVEIFRDIVAHVFDGFARQIHRIGTHIGDQADRAAADIDTLVQLLGGAHGAIRGHAELAYRLLLQRGGRKRRGRAA